MVRNWKIFARLLKMGKTGEAAVKTRIKLGEISGRLRKVGEVTLKGSGNILGVGLGRGESPWMETSAAAARSRTS